MIKTEDLNRHYHRGSHIVQAVNNINLTIEQGEFVALLGASGSGKSTLLNLLAGLDTPTSGHVSFEDNYLDAMTTRELSRYRAMNVGMVFQSFNLLPHFTALANVEAALLFNNTPRSERRPMAVQSLEKLGLSHRLDHRPADLSGGEQQRVALARALVKKPKILFADEPTGNLDHENSKMIANLLQDLNQKGLTVIIVTHDRDLAEVVSNRVLRINYGHLENMPENNGRTGENN